MPVGTDKTAAAETGKADSGIHCSRDDTMKRAVEWRRLAGRGHDKASDAGKTTHRVQNHDRNEAVKKIPSNEYIVRQEKKRNCCALFLVSLGLYTHEYKYIYIVLSINGFYFIYKSCFSCFK